MTLCKHRLVFAHINAFNDKDFVSKRGTINTQNFAMKQPIRTYDEDVSLCVIICKQGAPSQKRITLTMCQKKYMYVLGVFCGLWAIVLFCSVFGWRMWRQREGDKTIANNFILDVLYCRSMYFYNGGFKQEKHLFLLETFVWGQDQR